MKLLFCIAKSNGRIHETNILGESIDELRVKQCLAAEWEVDFTGSAAASENRLITRAPSWFSQRALTQLRNRVRKSNLPLSIVSSDWGEDGLPRVIADYFPAGNPHEQGGNFAKINTRELDEDYPPFFLTRAEDLFRLESVVLFERACQAMREGVRIRDPRQVYIRGQLICGQGVEIDLNVIIEGEVRLGDGVKVSANCILIQSTIGAQTRVNPFSIVEGATIGEKSFVGPYGRVRPGAKIGDAVQIGNFVEIKNSEIGAGSRINHHAFVGDSILAREVTLGAGCITCNHNGVGVSQTHIGAGAYVGSGTLLIAPVTIGENATIAAGSTITKNAPAEKLTVARARQTTVDGWKRPKK